MNTVSDYLNYISFVTFLDSDANQIMEISSRIGVDVTIKVTDEEYESSVCRQMSEKG